MSSHVAYHHMSLYEREIAKEKDFAEQEIVLIVSLALILCVFVWAGILSHALHCLRQVMLFLRCNLFRCTGNLYCGTQSRCMVWALAQPVNGSETCDPSLPHRKSFRAPQSGTAKAGDRGRE